MISASEALERLREGNRRFVADDCNGGQQAGKNRRRELAAGQETVRDDPGLFGFARTR